MHARSIRMRRWSRWEYEQLVERGFFRPDERLELLDGLMLVKEPQSSAHMTGIRLVEDTLRMAFGARWDVRTQGPIALDPRSEPEPDVSVVPGSPRDYRDAHPTSPALVVEVALASLRLDRACPSTGSSTFSTGHSRSIESPRCSMPRAVGGAIARSRRSGLTPLLARLPLRPLASSWPTSCRRRAVRAYATRDTIPRAG